MNGDLCVGCREQLAEPYSGLCGECLAEATVLVDDVERDLATEATS